MHLRQTVKRIGVAALTLLLVAVFAMFFLAQRADYGWRPAFAPRFADGAGPALAIDAAHHNGSSPVWHGRYWPLRRLAKADGYDVRINRTAFAASALEELRVLVVANASGAKKRQFLGINLPGGEGGDRGAPAFAASEIAAVRDWVANGGGLLLVADHAPFGASNAALAQAFGIRLHNGFVEVPGERSDPLRFTRENGRLGEHPILRDVRCVQTFTGQSLTAPADATILLKLPGGATEAVDHDGDLRTQAAGPAQAVAMRYGKGRVVALGEAAMLTAQVAGGQPFGFNLDDCDNVTFARNALAWLAQAP